MANPRRNVVDLRVAALAALFTAGVLRATAGGYRAPPDEDLADLAADALARAQAFWAARIVGWRDAQIYLVDRALATPCGPAGPDEGPFYCDIDERIYLDLSFLRAIDGDLARAYVIAHEIGHRVQHVQAGRVSVGTRSAAPTDVELQADCYAGLWLRDELVARRAGPDDVAAALYEAAAVGDDRICPGCSPETWTHGTSAARRAAVERGLAGDACP